ncbi:MAG: DUF1415 domain-containing protein [Saprospiraceae bacterium]
MENDYLSKSKNWIRQFVIGRQLCPFAKAVWDKKQIRFVYFEGKTTAALAEVLQRELELLRNTPASEIDTTVLVHPFLLNDFYDYLDFVAKGETLIADLNLEGEIQLASFHPNYQFAGTKPSAAENYTNRSPYPMLHLLREESISIALEHYPNPASIPEKNIACMNEIGAPQLKQMLHDFKR